MTDFEYEEQLSKLARQDQMVTIAVNPEPLPTVTIVHAMIVKVDQDTVTLNCIVAENPHVYSKRVLTKNLFQGVVPLSVGHLIVLKITEEPGLYKMEILDGMHVVNPLDFTYEDNRKEIYKQIVELDIFKRYDAQSETD